MISALILISINLLVVYRESVNLIGYITSDCKHQSVSQSSKIYDGFKENIPTATIMLYMDHIGEGGGFDDLGL